MKMELGKFYKIKDSVYDPWDKEDTYVIRITSKNKCMGDNDVFYHATVLGRDGVNYHIHFYPSDWAYIIELSSLEIELL